MLLPIKWLKDYVDFDLDVKKLADGLSNSGSHVESVIIPSEGLDKIVVGKIEKIINKKKTTIELPESTSSEAFILPDIEN